MTSKSNGDSTTAVTVSNRGGRKVEDDFYIFSGLRDLPEKAIENLICVHHPKLTAFFKKTLEYYSSRKYQDGERDFFDEHPYYYEDLPHPGVSSNTPHERSASPDSSIICLDYGFVSNNNKKGRAQSNGVPAEYEAPTAVNAVTMKNARGDINESSFEDVIDGHPQPQDDHDYDPESPTYSDSHDGPIQLDEQADPAEPHRQESRSHLTSHYDEFEESEQEADSAASPYNEQEIRMGESATSRPSSPSLSPRASRPVNGIKQITLNHRPIDEISLISGQLVIDEGDEDEANNNNMEDGEDDSEDDAEKIEDVLEEVENGKGDLVDDFPGYDEKEATEVNDDDIFEEPLAKKKFRSKTISSSPTPDESEESSPLSHLPPPPAPPSRTTIELELQQLQAINFSVPPPTLMFQSTSEQQSPFSPFSVPPPPIGMPDITQPPPSLSPMQFTHPPPSYAQQSSPMIIPTYQHILPGPFSPLPQPQIHQAPPPPRCLFPMQNPFGPNSPM